MDPSAYSGCASRHFQLIKCEPSDDIGLLVYHLLCAFLGAFSIGSDRISIGTPRSDLENDLLAEASYKCPRCGKKLIKEIEGTYPFRVFAELYDVYPIYPEKAGLMLCLEGGRTVYNPGNIDVSNSIVLCKSHRKELFERTSPEAYYEKLSLTKGELTALDADISKAEAMDCIYEILHSIDCPDAILEKDPRFDPLKISQKISPKENQTLFNQVCTESNPYYEYIKLQLSLLDDGPRKTWSKFSKAVAIYYQENFCFHRQAVQLQQRSRDNLPNTPSLGTLPKWRRVVWKSLEQTCLK